MRVFENGDEMMNIKVIVGKKDRPTPILDKQTLYATLNPSWTAPSTIVKEDILGKKCFSVPAKPQYESIR